jgi:phage FluMu protein Com
LKSSSPTGFAAGTSIKCPKCKQTFEATAETAVSHKAQSVPDDKPRKKAQVVDDEPDDDRPKKKKKKGGKKAAGGVNPALYWAIRGGVLAGLLVVAVVLWGMYQDKQKKNKEIEAENARIAAKNAEIEAREASVGRPITQDDINKAKSKSGGR